MTVTGEWIFLSIMPGPNNRAGNMSAGLLIALPKASNVLDQQRRRDLLSS
jgi:hypothetical protein